MGIKIETSLKVIKRCFFEIKEALDASEMMGANIKVDIDPNKEGKSFSSRMTIRLNESKIHLDVVALGLFKYTLSDDTLSDDELNNKLGLNASEVLYDYLSEFVKDLFSQANVPGELVIPKPDFKKIHGDKKCKGASDFLMN